MLKISVSQLQTNCEYLILDMVLAASLCVHGMFTPPQKNLSDNIDFS